MDREIKELVEQCEERASKATPGPWISSNQFGRTAIATPRSPYDSRNAVAGHYGINEADADFIAHAREAQPKLCAIIRDQDSMHKLLEREFSDVISGVAKELVAVGYVDESGGDGIVLAVRHVLQKQKAEIERLKNHRLAGRHEEETGVYHGDYNQHRETGWACNGCGQFSGHEHDPCEHCDSKLARLKAAIRRQTVDVDNGNKPNGPLERAIETIQVAVEPRRFYANPDGARKTICLAMAEMCRAMAADTKELCEAASAYFVEDFNKP